MSLRFSCFKCFTIVVGWSKYKHIFNIFTSINHLFIEYLRKQPVVNKSARMKQHNEIMQKPLLTEVLGQIVNITQKIGSMGDSSKSTKSAKIATHQAEQSAQGAYTSKALQSNDQGKFPLLIFCLCINAGLRFKKYILKMTS